MRIKTLEQLITRHASFFPQGEPVFVRVHPWPPVAQNLLETCSICLQTKKPHYSGFLVGCLEIYF
jgi:hypothetical protein